MKYFYYTIVIIIVLLSGWSPQVTHAETIAQSMSSPISPATAATNKPVSRVAVMTVSKDVTLLRQVLGTVFAPQMQTIAAQVTAIVSSNRLGMGTQVGQGEVLVRLDSREADAKLELALSELTSARIQLEKQSLEFSRVEQTFAKKLIPKADYDNARLALRKAGNDLKGFEARYTVAKLLVEKHQIVAPFRGVLMSSTPVVGMQLSPGQPVAQLVNTDELRISTILTWDELNKIRSGQAQLQANDPHNTRFHLLHAAPHASDSTGMFAAEFAIVSTKAAATQTADLPSTALAKQLPAQFYSGQPLKLALMEQKIHIPAQAIVPSAPQDYVLTVSHNQVSKVAVDDLTVGQQVVVLGHHQLKPGDQVAILALEELM